MKQVKKIDLTDVIIGICVVILLYSFLSALFGSNSKQLPDGFQMEDVGFDEPSNW